jgi:hypothetical protein
MKRQPGLSDLEDAPSPFVSRDLRVRPFVVRIADDHIIWDFTPDPTERVYPTSDFRLLQAFARLATAPDDSLLRFAQTYGPLGLCKHGFAIGHRDPHNQRCYDTGIGPEDLTRRRMGKESIQAWRRYAGRARGIVAVSAELRKQRRATADDWSWLLQGIPPAHAAQPLEALLTAKRGDAIAANPLVVALAAQKPRTLLEQRRALSRVVNHWLDESEIGVVLEWSGPGIDLRLGKSNPWGLGSPSPLVVIGIQLLRAVLRQESFVWCSECGSLYPPKRAPRAGEQHYCQECGRAAANRIAQRKFRERHSSENPTQRRRT